VAASAILPGWLRLSFISCSLLTFFLLLAFSTSTEVIRPTEAVFDPVVRQIDMSDADPYEPEPLAQRMERMVTLSPPGRTMYDVGTPDTMVVYDSYMSGETTHEKLPRINDNVDRRKPRKYRKWVGLDDDDL